MDLIKLWGEFENPDETEQFMRYDQYRRKDSQQHKDKLAADAAAVNAEAARNKIRLHIEEQVLPPRPFWCEEIIAKVSIWRVKADIAQQQITELG